MTIAAPADKHFRRAHLKPARRHRPWDIGGMRLVRLAVVLAVVGAGLYEGTQLVLGAQSLQISHIAITGNARLSRGEVLALLDGLRGRSMVTVSLEAWRQRLTNSPWVADAALRRVLPDTVTVAISERQPMGIGRIGGELYLVDQQGTVIDEYGPNYADIDLPIVDGLAVAPTGGGPIIDEARAALASRLLNSLGTRRGLSKRVSEIDVTDARDAIVILKGDGTLVRLGEEQFAERLQTYLDLAQALHERVPDMDYVDMRFDERLYVRPVGHPVTNAAARAASAAAAASAPGGGDAKAAKKHGRAAGRMHRAAPRGRQH